MIDHALNGKSRLGNVRRNDSDSSSYHHIALATWCRRLPAPVVRRDLVKSIIRGSDVLPEQYVFSLDQLQVHNGAFGLYFGRIIYSSSRIWVTVSPYTFLCNVYTNLFGLNVQYMAMFVQGSRAGCMGL